jgi:RimJ/RimL family protein N-acetyltransferase
VPWTAERIRDVEAEYRDRGIEQWVVAAVHEGSGEVAASTELEVHPSVGEQAFQAYTAVVREHRGHGLGRVIKAAMLRDFTVARPQILRINTNTGIDNVHMIRVNHEIGYQTVRTMLSVETDVAALKERLLA